MSDQRDFCRSNKSTVVNNYSLQIHAQVDKVAMDLEHFVSYLSTEEVPFA